MAKAKAASSRETREVVLQIPDVGLSKDQIASMKKKFHAEIVSSLGPKVAARIIIRIRIRIIIVLGEF